MKFKKLILENFRQYYGRQELDLDTTDSKNIIVIHGENGSGKTTILEALSWCLYGELNLINSNAILNEKRFFDLKDDDSAIAKVILIFDDRYKEYMVSREVRVRKFDNKQYFTKDDITFTVKADGEEVSSPKTTIEKILSKELKEYFFFDGERIDKLAKPESAKEIEEGIKNIMGISVYEKAIMHLKQVKKDLTEELKKVSDDSINSPFEEKERVEEEIDELKLKLKNLSIRRDEKERELNLISSELIKVKELESLEKEKNSLKKEKTILNEKLIKTMENEKKYISKYGYLGLSQSLINDIHSFLEEKRVKGELPSGIREQFIQDLLDRGKCICGTKIHKDDEHYKHLEQLLKNTIKKGVEDGFLKLNAFTSKYIGYQDEFLSKLQEFHKDKIDLQKSLDNIAGKLSDIKSQIEETAYGKSAELVAKQESIEEIIKETSEKIGVYKDRIQSLEQELISIEKSIEKYKAKNRQEEVAEKRLELCNKALKILEENYDLITEEVKNKLSSKVSNVFSSIIPSYNAKINQNFELDITKVINDSEIKVATSTGENQIASLSFIGSLVYLAKEWDEKGNSDLLTGAGVYPIVMDSPFGALDKEYRDLISAHLQKLAPQIIVMVSSSQWSYEVEKNLKPYINHEYILQYHTPTETKINESYKVMTIDDVQYDLTVISDYEFTEVVKVK
jgi:DNA sulfur modification protein DndD